MTTSGMDFLAWAGHSLVIGPQGRPPAGDGAGAIASAPLSAPPLPAHADGLEAQCLRVVLVDDSAVARAMYRVLLAKALKPADVTVFASAEQGLDALVREKADVVVSDYHMPGMNGLEFLSIVEQKGLARLRLLVSSDPDPQLPHLAREAGAHAFIPKTAGAGAFCAQVGGIGTPLRRAHAVQRPSEAPGMPGPRA